MRAHCGRRYVGWGLLRQNALLGGSLYVFGSADFGPRRHGRIKFSRARLPSRARPSSIIAPAHIPDGGLRRPLLARTVSFAPLESFPKSSRYPGQSLAPPRRAAGSPRGSKSRPEQKSAPNRVFGRRDRRATRVDFRRSYGGGPPRRGVQGLAKGLVRARDAARVIGWMCKILTHPPKHRSPGV